MDIQKSLSPRVYLGVIFFVGGLMLFVTGIVYYRALPIQKDFREDVSLSCRSGEESLSKRVVFLGDSITASGDWSALLHYPCAINAGVPGNITQDVFSRLDSVLETKPEKIFLMIGVNDLLRRREVSSILEDYKKIVDRIGELSPQTTLFLESVLPTDNSRSKIGEIDPENIIALNNGIRDFSDERRIFFLDIYPAFSDQNGSLRAPYTVDGVHLSSAGYLAWSTLLAPYLQ